MIDPYALLEQFMLAPAGSGYEMEMAKLFKQAMLPLSAGVECDRAGNIIARIPGTDPTAPTSMVFAHMDQIGFVITKVTDNGLLKLTRNGSVPDKVVPGLLLAVRTVDGNYLPAVISAKSHHVMSAEDKVKVEAITSLYADMGVGSKERAHELGVKVGCSVVYNPTFRRMDGSIVAGTSIDNRGGCLSLALIAEKLAATPAPGDVYIVGTTQEEHNLRGAMTAAHAIQPDVAICLDIAMSSDEPGMDEYLDNAVGGGPSISLYTYHGRGTLNGVIAHDGLVRLAERTAAEQSIPVQRFAVRGVLTDATYVQLEGKGPATIDLFYPMKYAHSPCELCDMRDLVRLGELVAGMLVRIGPDFQLKRYEV